MADRELDDMLGDLDDIRIGGGGVALPPRWGEARPASEGPPKQHSEREINDLLRTLEHANDEVLRVRPPELPPVQVSSAGRCGACRGEVQDRDFQRTGDGAVYHERCFRCSRCKRGIVGACDKGADGALVCRSCLDLPRCRRCAQFIAVTDKFVEADDGVVYHSGTCTTCAKCRDKLDLNNVFFIRGDLHCKNCA